MIDLHSDIISQKNKKVKTRKGVNKTHFCIYTPNEYCEEIVEKSVESYFNIDENHSKYDEVNKNSKVNKHSEENIEKYKKKLENLKSLDLSCGDGNLLIVLLEGLLEKSLELYGEYRFNHKWISGYDIDAKAIENLKVRIKELLLNYNINLDEQDFEKINLKVKNALEVQDEKYNIILGNPPYFGEKNNKERFQEARATEFGKKFYEPRMDYLYFFIEKGIELLDEEGVLSYITTNYWLRADSAQKLREYINENTEIIYLNNINRSIFEDAPGQHNMIFMLKKKEQNFEKNNIKKNKIESSNQNRTLITKLKFQENSYEISCDKIFDKNSKITLGELEDEEFCKKILTKKTFYLGELFEVNQGIISGCDKAFVLPEYNEKFQNILKPLYKNRHINKYSTNQENSNWILYTEKGVADIETVELLKDFLAPYKEKLSKRREVLRESHKWWELTWSRQEKVFQTPCIVARQRCKTNTFAYSEGGFYASADVYYLAPKDSSINIFYVLGYLNSELFYRWYKNRGKYKGENMEFYSTPLKETPIIYPDKKTASGRAIVEKIENLVKKQIEKYSKEREEELREYFNSLIQVDL